MLMININSVVQNNSKGVPVSEVVLIIYTKVYSKCLLNNYDVI